MNITIIYPHKRKTKSSTYGIAQMVLDRLLSGGTLHEFYLPQDMPHVCAGCYACMNGREDKCGGHEYMQKLIAAIDDSELIVFCAPTYVYHIPGQVKTLLDHFGLLGATQRTLDPTRALGLAVVLVGVWLTVK